MRICPLCSTNTPPIIAPQLMSLKDRARVSLRHFFPGRAGPSSVSSARWQGRSTTSKKGKRIHFAALSHSRECRREYSARRAGEARAHGVPVSGDKDCTQQQQKTGEIIALKQSDHLQRIPQSQNHHDQQRTCGPFQEESSVGDDGARRNDFLGRLSSHSFSQKGAGDEQKAQKAGERAKERAVRWHV